MIEELLGFDVFVEIKGVLSELLHFHDLGEQDFVKLLDVCFDVASWFVDIFQNRHFLLYDLDALLAAHVVFEDQLLLVFQDLFDKFLMVVFKFVLVVSIHLLQLRH